jgi:hypothetical protein
MGETASKNEQNRYKVVPILQFSAYNIHAGEEEKITSFQPHQAD